MSTELVGLVGSKLGMTRIFNEDGDSIPVSVIEVLPNKVTQIKTETTDGYSAVQVTTGSRRASRVTKARAGHFAKAKVEAGRGLWEFRLPAEALSTFELGKEITVDIFTVGQMVDVEGTTKGKGFAGSVKRWNFGTQPMSHGNSLSHRAVGSTGMNQTPGRVFKGKKMPGHLGDEKQTLQNLEIVRIDQERNLLLVKGAVPGSKGGDVIVTPAVKLKRKKA